MGKHSIEQETFSKYDEDYLQMQLDLNLKIIKLEKELKDKDKLLNSILSKYSLPSGRFTDF